MDYKEKYEQALMVAKETYDKQPMYREWLEQMFHELAESEDEKMRKELIRAFKSLNTIKVWNGIERTDILAWLEKQGETSPVLSNSSNIGKDEQKPAWSEEDNKWIESLIQTIEDGYIEGFNQLKSYGVIDWLKSLRPQKQWKPSERQLVCLQNTIEHFNLMGSPATTLNEVLKQLKKLKEE